MRNFNLELFQIKNKVLYLHCDKIITIKNQRYEYIERNKN